VNKDVAGWQPTENTNSKNDGNGRNVRGQPAGKPRNEAAWGSDGGGSPFSNAIKRVSCASLSHLNSLRQVIQNTHRTASGRPLSRKRSERERDPAKRAAE
jgi:hypothetical protein